ncbi:hypothetical protein BC739_004060 [Kutzneria viridogrisea]|uniref:EspG family protein n=2 Tax=Kutzneria viridogrisea TaxID=47990 RepID=A0ABR6BIY7_9PSEU|nr:hypothetical protein [Kutzneria viridogrisea]
MVVIELDYAELGVAWQRSQLPALPTVVTWRNNFVPPADPQHALDQAEARLRARGLLDRHLDDDLYGALALLAHAPFELDLRFAAAPGRELRACVTARAGHAARFLVDGDQVRIDTIPDHAATTALLSLLPAVASGPGHAVSLPTAELEAALARLAEFGEDSDAGFTAALRARGVRSDDARNLVALLGGERVGFGKIGVAVRDDAGRRHRSPTVLQVIDTARGRAAVYERAGYTVAAPADLGLLTRVTDDLLAGTRQRL